MILPIVAYGDAILKRRSLDIEPGHPDLSTLIQNMYDTMYEANGVGLAAPQVGKNIRLFITDGSAIESLKDAGFKKIFINPIIINEEGEPWIYEEGCLSIPGIRENVSRKPNVRIQYLDENFKPFDETYNGIQARIIQHEYDHLEGKLFVEYLPALKKQILKGKLSNISKGKVEVDYRMRFPFKK
ncbi:MAG: peptide deformylase [Bacteroidota bacterium]|nr:peptide deformylase [Bacteroidota bacterium]